MLSPQSKCKGSKLHDFQTIFEVPEAALDVCKRCKLRKFFRKDPNGRMNNRDYYKFHARDFLRPMDKHFGLEYNKKDYGLDPD